MSDPAKEETTRFRIELVDAEGELMREIANPAMKRDDVAATYALAMGGTDTIDWRKVNRAILDRWSMNALRYIKERAHRLHTGTTRGWVTVT